MACVLFPAREVPVQAMKMTGFKTLAHAKMKEHKKLQRTPADPKYTCIHQNEREKKEN